MHKDWVALIGRVSLAVLFIFFGYAKIGGFAGMVAYAASAGMPFPEVAIVLAIIIELGGGLMIALGWKTGWAAKALAVFTLVAMFFFHLNLADQAQLTMFLKDLSIFGGLLMLLAHGAGAYSLDAKMMKKPM